MKKEYDIPLRKLFLLGIFSFSQIAAVFPWDYVNKNNEGIKKYFAGEYGEAELLFRKAQIANSQNYQVKYNLADSLYKQGNYIESQEIYLDLLKDTELDANLKQKVFFNLGNIFYRMGKQKNSQMFWLTSLKQYESAMDLNSQDKEARENYEFVKNKLEQLNKQNKIDNKGKNNSAQSVNNNDKKQKAYSNSPSEPPERKIYSVSKSEVEEILQDMKLQEEGMQKYINRRQIKDNYRKTPIFGNTETKNSGEKKQNSFIKDW